MSKLSVSIMAVPERTLMVRGLLRDLGPLPREVTRCHVIWDRGHRGAALNGRACWLDADPRATHHLVLQDDIAVAQHLLSACAQIADRLPEAFVTLFANRQVIETARDRGVSWVTLRLPLMAQGYLMPHAWAADYVRWEKANVQPELNSYDARVCLWLDARDRLAWATVPSLVEHADQGHSVMRHANAPGGRPRTARWFIGREHSALAVDWTVPERPPHDGRRPGADYRCWLRQAGTNLARE